MEEKVAAIIEILKDRYPAALCALHYDKDYELMISVRLSAQCTDARVNQVTPALFAAYPTLEAMAAADIADVENYVRSCGFYKHKARDIVLACQMLRDEYGGKVPDKMEDLLRLPGVGRQSAARRPLRRAGQRRLRHALHPHLQSAGAGLRQGAGKGGAAAPRNPAAGGVV